MPLQIKEKRWRPADEVAADAARLSESVAPIALKPVAMVRQSRKMAWMVRRQVRAGVTAGLGLEATGSNEEKSQVGQLGARAARVAGGVVPTECSPRLAESSAGVPSGVNAVELGAPGVDSAIGAVAVRPLPPPRTLGRPRKVETTAAEKAVAAEKKARALRRSSRFKKAVAAVEKAVKAGAAGEAAAAVVAGCGEVVDRAAKVRAASAAAALC